MVARTIALMGENTHRLDPRDRAEIIELLARYAEAVDNGDFNAVGELLSDATLFDPAGNRIASGAEEITALFNATTKRHEDGTPRTAHLITNAIVDAIDDNTVELRARFLVVQEAEGVPLQPIVVGRYVDRVERRDGRWRFVARRMSPEFWGNTSAHLTFDPH